MSEMMLGKASSPFRILVTGQCLTSMQQTTDAQQSLVHPINMLRMQVARQCLHSYISEM